jgi:F-type H+-transporting ATPase subunit delta
MKMTPKQYARALHELCKKIPVNHIDEAVKEYILYLATRGKAKLLPMIAQELERYVYSQEGIIPVDVVSAHPLDEHTMADIKSAIKKSRKEEPRISFCEDPKLIGGVRVKIGHTVIDASVRSYIRQLKKHILVS